MYAQSATKQSYTTQWNAAANLKVLGSADYGTWDNAYGCAVDGDNSASGTLLGGNPGAIVCPEPGAYYTFTVDFATMKYSWTKLENQNPAAFAFVGLIGDGVGGWTENDDVAMTQVTPHNWYVETTIAEGGVKIRANHAWDTGNWGLSDGQSYENKGTLWNNGGSGNIPVPAGKYRVFFNDITCEYAFIAE